MSEINVLDHGSVKLVDFMGSDYSILRSARVSTGSSPSKGDEKDRQLIRYLFINQHSTPFEFAQFHFYVKCPIFVARQWFRTRTASYNEASARYKEFEPEAYVPESWRIQDTKNKQSSKNMDDVALEAKADDLIDNSFDIAYGAYNEMLEDGIAKEQARIVMPVAQYTEFYFSINLRNLLHFLELRLSPHAQYEIRVYAEAILQLLKDTNKFNWTVEVFEEYYLLMEELKKNMNSVYKTKAGLHDLEIKIREDY